MFDDPQLESCCGAVLGEHSRLCPERMGEFQATCEECGTELRFIDPPDICFACDERIAFEDTATPERVFVPW